MPTETTQTEHDHALVSVAGPQTVALSLVPPGPLTIGRRSSHALPLLGDDHVSRDHAMLVYRAGLTHSGGPEGPTHWALVDNTSRHGTHVNGVRIPPGREYPLAPGDLITIAPWTLMFVDRRSPRTDRSRVRTADDEIDRGAVISRLDAGAESRLMHRRLSLLLDLAGTLHAATEERALAGAVLDAALSGTGFTNGAVLRRIDEAGDAELIECRGPAIGGGAGLHLSRTLLREAQGGAAVRLSHERHTPTQAVSIDQLHIDDALCIPMVVNAATVGFLYLDSRGTPDGERRIAPDAGEFALALVRLGAMAWSNLQRVELERRHARIQAEIAAAAEAQRLILPQRQGRFGPLAYAGQSRPGRHVGGDFFDLIDLPGGRLALTLGDVAGKGVAAAVLMTLAQGFLHAALREHGEAVRAVADLNRFLLPRRPQDRFLTLWVGVFDPRAGFVEYVDAGHGYALALPCDGATRCLNEGGGEIIGVHAEAAYASARCPFRAGDRVMVVTDGLVEQARPGAVPREPFGLEGVRGCLASLPPGDDEIQALFDAVFRFAGGEELADDATAVVVRW